jgi:hypothetical protein
MVDMFLQRQFEQPLDKDQVQAMAALGEGCAQLYRFDWVESYLAAGGQLMCCWFRGPDLESVRTVLRRLGADTRCLWAGTVHHAPGDAAALAANVLVERRFEVPVEMTDIQALEDAGAWCLEAWQVRFVRTFFALDRRRMLCLYQAPDAESVRHAQRQAGMPVTDVWSFQRYR